MSLRQIEYALAVAEQGSVTAAAESLRVAQPSVSQQIRGLERELGVELFARTPTGLVPRSWWASWWSPPSWGWAPGSCRARWAHWAHCAAVPMPLRLFVLHWEAADGAGQV